MQRATLEQLIAARREGHVLVRALDVENGTETVIDPVRDRSPLGMAAAAAAEADASRRVDIDGRAWLLTVYNTPWELVLIGAVHIAQALAALAGPTGYRVRVIDPRAAYATPERFPGIELQQQWPDEALAQQALTPRSALIALAHDPKLDDAALAAALRSSAFYIGALGSERTQARRLARLKGQGFSDVELSRIRGPVGLAIGARSPAEIAIAILADLVQRRRGPQIAGPIAGLILAAGLSRRMGRNKLTMPLRGKPLIRHAVEAALAAALEPVIVVTGHEASAVRACLSGLAVTFVHNENFTEGLSSSLGAGVRVVPPACRGAMVLLGDMPDISAGLIRDLVAAFDPARSRAVCVATAAGKRGHPVLWSRQFFSELEALQGDTGGRSLMMRHPQQVCEVEAGDEALFDIDTPEALAAYSG